MEFLHVPGRIPLEKRILVIWDKRGDVQAARASRWAISSASRRRYAVATIRVCAYFEELDDLLISAVGWVTEAIGLVGGEDIFARPNARASKERQIESAAVRAADPQIIFASCCGKPINTDQIARRDGWHRLSAIRRGRNPRA